MKSSINTNHTLLLTLFVVAVAGGCSQEQEGVQGGGDPAVEASQSVPAPAVTRYSIEDLMGSVTYRGLSLSSDGSKLTTSSNASGIYNIVEIVTADGTITPLTDSDVDSNFLIGYFPDDDRILYTADQGGNEMNRIYVRELDGSVKNLTPEEGRYMVHFHGWSADGKSFFIRSNQRNIRHFDLYEISTEDYSLEMIYQNDDLYHLGPVSPDRQHLVLEKGTDNRSRSISLQHLGSGENRKITLSDVHIYNHAEAFSPDGRFLYYTTDKWHEFKHLMRYDMESREHGEVLKLDWDIVGGFNSGPAVRFSRDGNRVAVSSNQDARTVVDVYDVQYMARVSGSSSPEASVASWEFSKDGNQLALIITNGQIPGDIHLKEIASGTDRRLMASLTEKINPAHLVAGEVARFSSFDGLTVPGILYKPLQANAENKVPALIWVHGGPGGQTRITYSPLIQYMVNRGYAVYGINNRGSSGSGKTFYHLDDQDHGGGDLQDVVASKQFMIDTGWVKDNQVGVIGGSYGGFMVLAALAFEPDVFDIGVDIFGVANWVRTLSNPPPWWAAQWVAMQTEMGDFYDEKHWHARSPMFHAGNIIKPLMVLQGANDARVKQFESDEMVAEVKKNGTPVEYIVFDDEGHGFRKKKNQIVGYKAIVEFLDTYLLDKDQG